MPTNDVAVVVWIGYDGATGGHVAVPIFEPVIEAAWANIAPRTALTPPSPAAKRQLRARQ